MIWTKQRLIDYLRKDGLLSPGKNDPIHPAVKGWIPSMLVILNRRENLRRMKKKCQ